MTIETSPEAEWASGRVPTGYWDRQAHRRSYVHWLGEQLGYSSPGDWYQVTQSDFKRHYGAFMLNNYYSGSPYLALLDCVPDYEWLPWQFKRVPINYWTDARNRVRYMRWLGAQLGIVDHEDWLLVSRRDFRRHRGESLLNSTYAGSHFKAIHEYLENMRTHEWMFGSVPNGFWRQAINRSRYMDWLSKQLSIAHPDDWYDVSPEDFERHNGATLLRYHNNSVAQAVLEYMPEHAWKAWLFPKVPRGYWAIEDNRRQYLDWLGNELGFKEPSDWAKLRISDVCNRGGATLVKHYYRGSLTSLLEQNPLPN